MPDDWIRQSGDPVLYEVAAPVTAPDDILRGQIARMKRRLAEAEGVGLAATQVGFLRRRSSSGRPWARRSRRW